MLKGNLTHSFFLNSSWTCKNKWHLSSFYSELQQMATISRAIQHTTSTGWSLEINDLVPHCRAVYVCVYVSWAVDRLTWPWHPSCVPPPFITIDLREIKSTHVIIYSPDKHLLSVMEWMSQMYEISLLWHILSSCQYCSLCPQPGSIAPYPFMITRNNFVCCLLLMLKFQSASSLTYFTLICISEPVFFFFLFIYFFTPLCTLKRGPATV